MKIEPMIKKPSLFRRTVMSLVNGWRRVMDVRYNPIGKIPDPSLQTYFMLVLFTVWSVWFGFLATDYLGFFSYNTVVSIVIHVAILLPLKWSTLQSVHTIGKNPSILSFIGPSNDTLNTFG